MAGQVLGARELKRRARMEELLTLERGYWARGLSVAGMDEVGRGPLAGPVVAACVMLSPDGVLPGVDDSKKLSESRREQLAPLIRAAAQFGVLLVDAMEGLDCGCPTESIVHGDATSYMIAAASIVAKVHRDALMREYDVLYPEYGFARNKGYGTAEHIAALCKYGPCPIHRRSFISKWL